MIEVKIPATSANLGPGFDTLGLALDLYNTFSFKEISNGLHIDGFGPDYNSSNNLVYKSMIKTFEKVGYRPKGISIEAKTEIPISRGLGSSSSCIIGGILGANHLAGDPLSKDEILKLAIEIEGHPDNVAPALFGGLVVSVMDKGQVYYNIINIHKGLKFVALIPDFTLSTKAARDLLPSRIAYQDGVYNTGRLALLLSALTNGRFDLLRQGLKDKFHQPYRCKLIDGYDEIVNKSREFGALGEYLSGAGPTIMALVYEDDKYFVKNMESFFKKNTYNWQVKELYLNTSGPLIKKTNRP